MRTAGQAPVRPRDPILRHLTSGTRISSHAKTTFAVQGAAGPLLVYVRGGHTSPSRVGPASTGSGAVLRTLVARHLQRPSQEIVLDPIGTSFLTHSCDELLSSAQRDAHRTVVWLLGEHDASTVVALSATFAEAISLDHPELVVDLSGVKYLGAATVSLIVQNVEYLRLRSRSLTLRNPNTCSRRVLDVCDLSDCIEPRATTAPMPVGHR